jgi:hypothetical protein
MISAIVSIVMLSGCGEKTMTKTGFLSDYSKLQPVLTFWSAR